MKKNTRKIRDNIFIFILGGIVCSGIVVLAEAITSSMVEYDNSTSHASTTTVQSALDDLYTKVPNSAGLSMIANSVPGLSASLEAGLYRYQGTTADNYICFGTTNKNTCTSDTDKYMYRIMGITADGKMKLIKRTEIGSYGWHSSLTQATWLQSSLYTNLNGSYFLTNTTYVPNGWETRIADTDWHYWTGKSVNMTAADMATAELGAATVNAKIGLMYIHDYDYALAGGNNCGNSSNNATCKTSWLYLGSDEWTISSYDTMNKWYVSGIIYRHGINQTMSVRPVFYLTSSQVINGGTGTLADPYVLR